MNFLALSNDDRKSLYKLVTEKEYKTSIKGNSKLNKLYLKVFKKTMDRTPHAEVVAYVNDNILDTENEICKSFISEVAEKILERFPNADKIEEITNENEYNKLTDEQKQLIDEYKQEYEDAKMPIAFEDFIKFSCKPDNDSLIMEGIKKGTIELGKQLDKTKEKLENEEKKIEDLKAANNALLAEKKEAEKEVKELKKELSKNKKILTLENTVFKLKDILPKGYKETSFEKIYETLTEMETISLKNKDQKIFKILAAKYALNKVREENKQ